MASSDGIEIPVERLSAEALTGLIDAFVLQEGTDYGHAETTLADKRAQVHRQIERGEVAVVFDPKLKSASLVLRRDLPASSG